MYGYNNPQFNLDRINSQMAELEKMKQQLQQPMTQPTNLTQNFQITPNNTYNMRYAKSLDDVSKILVYADTPFFSNDMSVVWIKNAKGDIKTYELIEIIPKDSKDLEIEILKDKINELEGIIKNDAKYTTTTNAKQNESSTTKYNESNGDAIEKNKSTSLSKVSGSKKK